MNSQDKSYMILSRVLREILHRPKLEEELKSLKTRPQIMNKLKIDDDMCREVLNILNDLRQSRPLPELEVSESGDNLGNKTDRDFLYESFNQLRTAYRTSLSMSVIIFSIGVAFLVIAAIRSITDPQSVVLTSVIGGIGIVQIVALFYRNPLTHIAQTVSNTQQAKMAVMSYLLGISLLNQEIKPGVSINTQMDHLIRLTERALWQLQVYTERDKTKVRIAKVDSSKQSSNRVSKD